MRAEPLSALPPPSPGSGAACHDLDMEIAGFVLAVVSLLVALAGTYLSNKRSGEALEASQKAVTSAAWSSLQEAVQRLIGFDPAAEPVGERLANLRIAMLALVDELDTWESLDTWLEAERHLGAALGRQVMTVAQQGDSVDQRLQKLDPLITWAHALSQNLRLLRSKGHNPKAVRELQANAERLFREVHEKHGWEIPPRENPRIRPL